jgi:hypothetical protein
MLCYSLAREKSVPFLRKSSFVSFCGDASWIRRLGLCRTHSAHSNGGQSSTIPTNVLSSAIDTSTKKALILKNASVSESSGESIGADKDLVMTPAESLSTAIEAVRSRGILPSLNEAQIQEMNVLDARFERLCQEELGPVRGIETTRQIIQEERLEKRATKEVANIYLNNWLYSRYALQLGYERLNKVPAQVVAETLIRVGTEIRFFRYKNPKTILKELFRYGRSAMQARYQQKDALAVAKAARPNGPTTARQAAAVKEDPRLWDESLFAHKWVGKQIHRPSKWGRKRKK